MPLGNEITALQEAKKLIGELREALQGANTDLLAISKLARESQGNFANIKLPKELQSSLQANQTFLSQLNANVKERERLERALQQAVAKRVEAESKINKELLKNREETRLLNKAMKDEAILSSTLVGEYRKLEVRHSRAAKTVRDLSAANKENTKEYKRAERELKRYRAQLDRADKATGNFRRNVGNYSSAFQAATGAFRQFAGIFGVYSGLQIAREIFEQVKALDALDKALRAVTKTQEGYNESQEFILDISDRYGLEIRSLTENYTSYLAALQGTTLEGEKGRRIFESLNRVSAKLNLTQEKQNGVLNAFIQIISKGTVQAEELRGQLGDRLPGAFNIMARAIGVTTEELNQMLKDGEVIADQVLPKFAEELERTFGTQNLTRINSLVAAQNRLSNEWTKFLNSLTTGDGILNSVFSSTLDVLTSFLNIINEVREGIAEVFESEKVKAARQEYENFAKVTNDQINSLNTFVISVDRLNAAFEQYADLQANVSKRLQQDPAFTPELADESAEALLRLIDNTSTYNEFLEKSADVVDRNDLLSKSYLATLFARVKGINQVVDSTTRQIERENELQAKLGDTSEAADKARKKLQELATISFGTTVQEAEKLKKEAEEIADALSGTNLSGDNVVSFGVEALDVPNSDEVSAALQKIAEKYKLITKEAKLSADQQREIFDQLFSTFSNYYGLDLTAFSKLIGGKEATLEDYANFAKSVSSSILESRLIRYENEIVANQERLDAILNDDQASEEKKRQAQIEADKKERQIRTRQAKAERTNTLIQIGIDTAAAIAKTIAALGIPAALPFIGIAAGLGAAQAAFVASQPLPRFERGTKNAPEGLAVVDEKGPELHLDKKGKVKSFGTYDGATVRYLERGDQIIPANQTAAIIAESEQERIDLAVMRMNFNMINGMRDEIKEGIKDGFKGVKINNRILNKMYRQTTDY